MEKERARLQQLEAEKQESEQRGKEEAIRKHKMLRKAIVDVQSSTAKDSEEKAALDAVAKAEVERAALEAKMIAMEQQLIVRFLPRYIKSITYIISS